MPYVIKEVPLMWRQLIDFTRRLCRWAPERPSGKHTIITILGRNLYKLMIAAAGFPLRREPAKQAPAEHTLLD